MKKMNNDKGLTLIEVLATVVILAIVGAIFTSILMSSQKQKIDQTTAAMDLADESYALKVITKDIRRATADPIEYKVNIPSGVDQFDGLQLTLSSGVTKYEVKTEIIDTKEKKHLVKKVGASEEVIASNIGCFTVDVEGSKVQLALSTAYGVTNCDQDIKEIQKTTIQLRKGDGG